MKQTSFFDRFNDWASNSITLKLLVIGILILLLLIPAGMLTSLIYERQNLRDQAITEVSSKWGQSQTVAGPVISVPYNSVQYDAEGKAVRSTGYVHFLPDAVQVEGEVTPQERHRGIYVVVLYNAKLQVAGSFGEFNAAALSVPEQDLRWEDAIFTIGISDMTGVESAIELRLNDSTYQLGPGTVTNDILPSGASVPLNLRQRPSVLNFSYALDLNGSGELYFTPFGKETNVQLRSSWPDPSFEGTFLPDDRSVTGDGFQATWRVLQLNRNYPQQGVGSYIGQVAPPPHRDPRYDYAVEAPGGQSASSFGVRLLLPIDEYQKTMRSAKYAAMFVFITFLTFFFIEVLNRKRLHPIQYLLVGAAVILFYVLLLSFSEHLTFNTSYLIGSLIILGLITGYSAFILRNRFLTLLVGVVLAILYGFFFSILQLQDYALLLGSLGLLLILATIMYLTRNVDWYALRRDSDES